MQATEEVSKNLVAMKEILYGTNEKEPQTEAVAQLAQELYNSGLLSTLVADLQLIDFEVGKYVLMIISNLNFIKNNYQNRLFFSNLHAWNVGRNWFPAGFMDYSLQLFEGVFFEN